jgi:hypothetical protein
MPSQRMQKAAFQQVFNSVEKITSLDIDYQKNSNLKTDFTIAFLNDLHVFSDKKSVLAHVYFYFPNSAKNGVIEFNDSPQSKWYFTPLGWPVPAFLVDPANFKEGQRDVRTGKLVMRASQRTISIGMHELRHSFGGRHDLKDSSTGTILISSFTINAPTLQDTTPISVTYDTVLYRTDPSHYVTLKVLSYGGNYAVPVNLSGITSIKEV